MNLWKINQAIQKCDITSEWDNCLPYKIIQLFSDLTTQNLSGKDKTNANKKHGVYRWKILDQVVYVGRATDSTVGSRQISHMCSFRNLHNRNERTGKKLREYMLENSIDNLVIQIEYIDMTGMEESIEWFEKKCIQHWKPILNSSFSK